MFAFPCLEIVTPGVARRSPSAPSFSIYMSVFMPTSGDAIDFGWPGGSAMGVDEGAGGEEPLLVARVVRDEDAEAPSAHCWRTIP